MAYHVRLTESAFQDIHAIENWGHGEGSLWFFKLVEALYSLESMPNRCPIARESLPGESLRCLVTGRKPHRYRILYRVLEGDIVEIIHVRHGASGD